MFSSLFCKKALRESPKLGKTISQGGSTDVVMQIAKDSFGVRQTGSTSKLCHCATLSMSLTSINQETTYLTGIQ